MSADTKTDPRVLVTTVSMDTLIDTVLGDSHPFAILELDGLPLRFICPKCGKISSNGGTAEAIDGWRWRCRPCRFTGTRIVFERMILEDAVLMDRFFQLLSEGAK